MSNSLCCPHCGNADLEQFNYHEDVVVSRGVRGQRLDGTLLIDAAGEAIDDRDNETSRMHCGACGGDFPITVPFRLVDQDEQGSAWDDDDDAPDEVDERQALADRLADEADNRRDDLIDEDEQ